MKNDNDCRSESIALWEKRGLEDRLCIEDGEYMDFGDVRELLFRSLMTARHWILATE